MPKRSTCRVPLVTLTRPACVLPREKRPNPPLPPQKKKTTITPPKPFRHSNRPTPIDPPHRTLLTTVTETAFVQVLPRIFWKDSMACRVCMIDECVQCTVSRPRETRDSLTHSGDRRRTIHGRRVRHLIRQQTLFFPRQGRHREGVSSSLFHLRRPRSTTFISLESRRRNQGFTNPPSKKRKHEIPLA